MTWALKDFRHGDRIKVHAWTDRFMQGDAWAVVQRLGRKNLTVRFERSGQVVRVAPGDVDQIAPRSVPAPRLDQIGRFA